MLNPLRTISRQQHSSLCGWMGAAPSAFVLPGGFLSRDIATNYVADTREPKLADCGEFGMDSAYEGLLR